MGCRFFKQCEALSRVFYVIKPLYMGGKPYHPLMNRFSTGLFTGAVYESSEPFRREQGQVSPFVPPCINPYQRQEYASAAAARRLAALNALLPPVDRLPGGQWGSLF
ncbi:hypothetical protein [robinz microvirus RP_94]|nr:hypothetical protein [robinz microvirus RP_94]